MPLDPLASEEKRENLLESIKPFLYYDFSKDKTGNLLFFCGSCVHKMTNIGKGRGDYFAGPLIPNLVLSRRDKMQIFYIWPE